MYEVWIQIDHGSKSENGAFLHVVHKVSWGTCVHEASPLRHVIFLLRRNNLFFYEVYCLPTITRPYLQRVIPTQIWCRSVMNPRLALIHPKSAFILRPSPVVISSIFLERTVDRSTIPNSLPVRENGNFLTAFFTEIY